MALNQQLTVVHHPDAQPGEIYAYDRILHPLCGQTESVINWVNDRHKCPKLPDREKRIDLAATDEIPKVSATM